METVAQIESLGRRAIAVNRDLAIEPGVLSLLAECANELAPVSCVVNNASLFEYDNVTRFSADHLMRAMRTNASAPILLARSLHEHLKHDARGVVINLLDQKLENPNPDFLSYTLSKAALKEATKLLAIALAPKVRVVGIAPGITLASTLQSERGFAEAHRRTPLNRSSTPYDVARAAIYLANAEAVTGAILLVDGGQHLVPSSRDVMFLTEPQAEQ